MASLYITEFQASGNAESGAQLQVGMQPAGWFDGDMLDNPAPVATIEHAPPTLGGLLVRTNGSP